jgi:hypothetical protein
VFLAITVFQFLALVMFASVSGVVFRIIEGKDLGLVCMLVCLTTHNILMLAFLILYTVFAFRPEY